MPQKVNSSHSTNMGCSTANKTQITSDAAAKNSSPVLDAAASHRARPARRPSATAPASSKR